MSLNGPRIQRREVGGATYSRPKNSQDPDPTFSQEEPVEDLQRKLEGKR